jgi:hypothetical protein
LGGRSLVFAVNRSGFVTLAVAALVAIGCGDGLPSLDDLKASPAAGIHPTDAVVVSHFENNAEQTVDGPVVAMVGDVFAINDDPDSVFEFYEAGLTKLGFVRDDHDLSVIKTVMETDVRVWRQANVVARVSIFRTDDPQLPPIPPDFQGGTVFELTLIARPPIS